MLNLPSEKIQEMRGHTGPVLAVRFNGDGNYCISCGQDRMLRLWNPVKGASIKTYIGHGQEVHDVAIASDNSRLASCGGDKLVHYWDVSTGQIIRKLRGHDLRVNAVVFAGEESSLIVSGSYDKTLRFFDCRSRSTDAIQTVGCFKDSVTSLSVRESEVLAGCVDGSIRVFDVRKGEMRRDCLGHPVTSVAFSRDGNCLLGSCMDSTVRLMDKNNGEMLQSYKGHKSQDYKVETCMTHGDSHVVAGSEDGSVYFWDLIEGKVSHKLSGHSHVVCGLSYHPTADRLLSCSVDGTIALWG